MKIYLAGKLSQREDLHEIRRAIWNSGHEVISTWIDEGGDYSTGTGGEKGLSVAIRDLTQISMADVLILDTTAPLSADGGGGREFEAGFAFGQFQHKEVWRVGPLKNAFHNLAVRSFENWDQCLKYLEGLNGK